MYFQVAFAFYRIKVMAPKHPEWKDKQPYKAVLEGDMQGARRGRREGAARAHGRHALGHDDGRVRHCGRRLVRQRAHPRFKRPYTDLVYQPMLELLSYLRANGFKTFIVSGGGVEFMRVFAERVYGIPPEQVVGSSGVLKFEMRDGKPVLVKEPKVEFIDDEAGKPVGIQPIHRPASDPRVRQLGRRSADARVDCCRQRCALLGIVHHTDAEREWAYDRDSKIGTFDTAWDEATANGWTVVDMKQDWKVIFPT